jgi:hypothetical protein
MLSLSSLAQTTFTESFDGTTFVPTGWSLVTTSTSATWARVTTSAHPTGISPHSGVGMVRFNSWTYSSGIQSMITPSFDLSGRGTTTPIVRIWIYRESGFSTSADKVDIMINTTPTPTGATLLGTVNRSRTLTPAVSANGWYQYSYSVPTIYNGTTNYLIIRGTSAFGNDIHVDDIQWTEYKKPCTGIPNAGVIQGPSSVCMTTSFTLSLFGNTTDPGITYQWQSKPTSTTIWSNILGATSSSLTTSITSYTDYRCIVTCTNSNQTSYTASYTVMISNTANLPLVMNDSVCYGQTALVYCYWKDTTSSHKWYSSFSSTTPFFTGDSLYIPNIMNDTTIYVNSVNKNTSVCASPKVPVKVFVGYPPVVNLGSDIEICLTPIILDAGQYGASSYLWNTGESSQTITVKNSGTYWVEVDRYCKGSDTVNIVFDLPATCSGISYIRIGDDFVFSVAGPNLVTQYTWAFSDGTTQYGASVTKKITSPMKVELYVSNDCGGMMTFLILYPTDIKKIQSDNDVSIIPNPTKGKLNLVYSQNKYDYVIYITDVTGKIIIKEQNNPNEIDLSEQPNGTYNLHIKNKNISYIKRIVKNN